MRYRAIIPGPQKPGNPAWEISPAPPLGHVAVAVCEARDMDHARAIFRRYVTTAFSRETWKRTRIVRDVREAP